MALIKSLIAEIENETLSTKKILAIVPEDKFDWRPHTKSMTIKQLATHVANLSAWAGLIANTDYLVFLDGSFKHPDINNVEGLLKELETGTQQSITALQNISEDDLLNKQWVLRAGDKVLLELPKYTFIRSMALNHTYHHRAQLSVYLRLLDIPIPGIYGPSADEMPKS